MKILFSLILSIILALSSKGQKAYFIYLQTEDGSGFYAKLMDKVISSNSSGYLILSNLIDSTYNIVIGTGNTAVQTARFSITVNNIDKGYIIRTTENNLDLTDLETSSVIKPIADKTKKNVLLERRSDDFTRLLSKSASDPSLLFVPVPVKEDVVIKNEERSLASNDHNKADQQTEVVKPLIREEKEQEEQLKMAKEKEKEKLKIDKEKEEEARVKREIQFNDSLAKNRIIAENKLKTDTSISIKNINELKNDSLISKTQITTDIPPLQYEYVKSTVKKHSESSTTGGFGLVFFDTNGDKTDTIQMVIPNPKIQLEQGNIPKQEEKKPKAEDKQPITKTVITVDSTAIKNIKNGNDSARKEAIKNKNTSVLKPIEHECKAIATSNDFFRIRKNMAAKTTDESMVSEAKRFFRSKCFTTEQIRNLSSLFLTSAGKFLLFDASFGHVSDKDQFASLQSELRDDYYIKRFKELTGE